VPGLNSALGPLETPTNKFLGSPMLKEALRDGVHCWRNEIVTRSVALFKRIMLPWGHVARPLFDGMATFNAFYSFYLFTSPLVDVFSRFYVLRVAFALKFIEPP